MIKIFKDKKFLTLFLIQTCLILSAALVVNITGMILPQEKHHALFEMSFLWSLPFLVLVTFLYFLATNVYNTQKSFKIFLCGFGALFLGCAIVSCHGFFHITLDVYGALLNKYPGFAGIIDFYAHWSEMMLSISAQSFYFVFVNVFFWQLLMDLTPKKEAKVVYPAFALLTGFITWGVEFMVPFLVPYKSAHPTLYIPILALCVLWAGIFAFQKSLSAGRQKQPQAKPISTLESFGPIFTSSAFISISLLTFLFFVTMWCLRSLSGGGFVLFYTAYGLIQMGYVLLPENIRAKSKALIDMLIAVFSLWFLEKIMRAGFIMHALEKTNLKTFVMMIAATSVGVFVVISYQLIKKLKGKG